MLSLVLGFPVFLPSDEWSNLIVKLFVPFLLFSINCIRGTIGWGRCSIDNIFYFNTMPASNTTTHYVLWGNNIFEIFQNEFKENYKNVPIKKNTHKFLLVQLTIISKNLTCDQFHPHVLYDAGILNFWYIIK